MPVLSNDTNSSIHNVVAHKLRHDAHSAVLAKGNLGATPSLALDNVAYVTGTLTANATFTFALDADAATGTYQSFRLELTQDGTGSRTATWPASVVWTAATAPTLTATAGKTDIFEFYTRDAGTNWIGRTVQLNVTLA